MAKVNIKNMENKKIRVVWLCHFSNSFVHEKLELKYNPVIKMIMRLAHKSVSLDVPEFANWITNGIREFEKIDEVELHVVSPYPHLKAKLQEFEENGVYYHFFRSEDDTVSTFLYNQLFRPQRYYYKRNNNVIRRIISRLQPQIVHLFGAENPDYAVGVLNVPKEIITIAQLQTLLNDPAFTTNTSVGSNYKNRAAIEQAIISHVDYVATTAAKYREIIHRDMNPSAIILNTGLALKDPIVTEQCEKKYDFVYFAANISKAADLALEAFAIAYKTKPGITLDIIGGYADEYKSHLDNLIDEYGIMEAVKFEGSLPTHEDVLKQIRLSKFALLPLKVDLTSGTIREAMSNGLPVVTTDTGKLGTLKLNLKRQNVLISPIGDHQALADNMLRLLDDENLAETLRQNAYQTRSEVRSNEMTARRYVEAYKACIAHSQSDTPLPVSITEV